MKKQSGFTLIELMVVMAIIAILATAGLAAYTGYIKKARDTTRIADLGAIQSIVLANLSSTGKTPTSGSVLSGYILAANNNQPLKDPLTTKSTCLQDLGPGFTTDAPCEYQYEQCDNGTGFVLLAPMESSSNTSSAYYQNNGYYFKTGSCTTACTGTGGCTTNGSEWI